MRTEKFDFFMDYIGESLSKADVNEIAGIIKQRLNKLNENV